MGESIGTIGTIESQLGEGEIPRVLARKRAADAPATTPATRSATF